MPAAQARLAAAQARVVEQVRGGRGQRLEFGGATFTTFQAEADALVAAGAATYADPAYVPPVIPGYPIAS
jgi:hypothetical protein